MIAGRYTLEREIGRGGMGPVYLATDEVLGREVALKRIGLLPGADSTDLARAEREARLAARLNHPHVVAIFNLVVDEDTDAHWLVMEHVEGTTLSELVKQHGPLSPDDAAPLLQQAADALVAAHAAGIVHRDVKPSNILVDERRRAKLTDFGIARISADPSLTQTGMVTGSPAYLAPEAALGQGGGEAVDVWSLGATVFHVLSGRTPYDMGDNVIAGLYRIVHEEPPRLADAGWMGPLLDATMAKDPADRWTMTQVRDFLADRGAHATESTLLAPVPAPVAAPVAPTPTPTPHRAPVPPPVPRQQGHGPRRLPPAGILVGLAVALVLGLVVATVALLRDDATSAGDAPADTATAGASPTPSSSTSASARPAASRPTARGMESFIRSYVAAIAADPAQSFEMLTPKFQRQSGGARTYRDFWDGVGEPTVLDITADPDRLVVSYRVRFENFGTGKRPTVLDLTFDDGRYLIDGERTAG